MKTIPPTVKVNADNMGTVLLSKGKDFIILSLHPADTKKLVRFLVQKAGVNFGE